MTRSRFTGALLFAVAFVLLSGAAQPASAQVFLSPIVGYNFGGDSGCPGANASQVLNCEDKNLNLGVAVGSAGDLFGFEAEFAYAKDFFGDAAAFESSVVTLMSNFMLVPNVGPVRPYGLIGIGLIRSNVEFGAISALSTNNNKVAWDVGGGIIGQFGGRFGLRGDVRFFKAINDTEILGLDVDGSKLNFARVGVGFMIFF